MTRDEIVDVVKQRMGNYNNADIDAHIVTEMKLNQTTMEQEASLPWFLVTVGEGAGTADVASAGALSVSRGGTSCAYLAEYEENVMATYLTGETSADKTYMAKANFVDAWKGNAEGRIANDDAGHPSYYAMDVGAGIGRYAVFPPPIVAWTLAAESYYADVPLDTDITNLWLTYAPDMVIAKVGLIIAGQYTVLEKFVPAFGAQIKMAEERLAKINALKAEENIRRLMGDS